MFKKVILISLIGSLVITTLYFGYKYSIPQQKTSPTPQKVVNINSLPDLPGDLTEENVTPLTDNEAKTGEAINILQKSLPLSTQSFSISSYDYSKGKFIVAGYNGTPNLQVDFDTWYQTSSFTAIPRSMFLLPSQ